MKVKFTHYLITRYNIHLDEWETDRRGQPTLKDDWMEHRYELFSKYCLPSVVSQSQKNFVWLIYFESSTSPAHMQQITSLVNIYPFIQLRLVSGYFGCMNEIETEIRNAQTEYVITSRLDNDDCIGKDFIKTIQSYFIPRDKILINLLHGYSYTPERHIVTRLHKIQTNSFCSFIEKVRSTGGHISVRGFPHGNPPPGTEIINVDSRYSWLRVFHKRNFKSKPFGYPVFLDHYSQHYGVDKKHLSIRFLPSIGYSVIWALDGVYRRLVNFISSNEYDH